MTQAQAKTPAASALSNIPPLAKAAQAASPAASASGWKVIDRNATQGPRDHEMIVDGKPVKYRFPDQYTKLPVGMEVALRFLNADGFEVYDPQDRLVKRAERTLVQSKPDEVLIRSDECIAKYTEITHDALIARAKKMGGNFTKQTPKDDLISFLIAQSAAAIGMKAGGASVDGQDDLIEDDGDDNE